MATFVLVPGAWLGGWVWELTAGRLREGGHEVHPVTLPGLGERAELAGPGIDLDSHVDDVVRRIRDQDLEDVVLLGHSYAGIVATSARWPRRATAGGWRCRPGTSWSTSTAPAWRASAKPSAAGSATTPPTTPSAPTPSRCGCGRRRRRRCRRC